jgi:hypothetical protein
VPPPAHRPTDFRFSIDLHADSRTSNKANTGEYSAFRAPRPSMTSRAQSPSVAMPDRARSHGSGSYRVDAHDPVVGGWDTACHGRAHDRRTTVHAYSERGVTDAKASALGARNNVAKLASADGRSKSWTGSWTELAAKTGAMSVLGASARVICAGRALAASGRATLNPRVRGSSPWRRTRRSSRFSEDHFHVGV